MPQYMIQLYKELTTGDDVGVVKKKMPYSANAIRGLNSATTVLSNSSMKIYFDLGYFKNGMAVNRDEVHLHMSPPDPADRNSFKPFVLRLNDIHTNKLIRKYKVPAFNQGWQVLSLNKWTNTWVKNSSSNKGVLITIHRGGGGKEANKNPFIKFPSGNDPYMIIYTSERVQTLMALRFLIQNALNSVSGNTQGSQQSQGGQRLTRDLSHRSQGGRRLAHRLSRRSQGQHVTRNTSQQSQCKAVETDKNLTDLKVNGRSVIIHPKVYKMFNCSNSCIMRPARGYFHTTPNNGPSKEKYCCVPTKRLDLMVLLKDPLTGDIEVQLLKNFLPTGCMWSKQ
ncbi:bone morphogenetic 2-like [Paramuricea clavata]|nr:bone morphogenetic 2-like [Paramuricea clavata]